MNRTTKFLILIARLVLLLTCQTGRLAGQTPADSHQRLAVSLHSGLTLAHRRLSGNNNNEIPQAGFGIEARGSFTLFRGLEMSAGMDFSTLNLQSEWNLSTTTIPGADVYILVIEDFQKWLSFPLTLDYRLGRRRLQPYFTAGVMGGVLLSSTAAYSRTPVDGSQGSDSPRVDSSAALRKGNVSAILGGGIAYKMGRGFLQLNARYHIGLLEQLKGEFMPIASDSDILAIRFVNMPNYKLDYWSFSIGYRLPLGSAVRSM